MKERRLTKGGTGPRPYPPLSRRVIKVLMKTSMNIYPFLAEAPAKLVGRRRAVRCSFLFEHRAKVKRGRWSGHDRYSMRQRLVPREVMIFWLARNRGESRSSRGRRPFNWKAWRDLHSNASLLSTVDRDEFLLGFNWTLEHNGKAEGVVGRKEPVNASFLSGPLKNRSRLSPLCTYARARVFTSRFDRSYPRNFPMDDVSSEMTEWRVAEGTPREARFVSELTWLGGA